MPIWGVDIHPRYQAGVNIEQIRRDGFDFLAVKVSEATDGSFLPAGSADFLRRGKAAGLLCLGYHYLRAGNEDAQARLFAAQLRAAGVPGMLDAEDGAGDIANIRRFIDRCRAHGAHVPLMYLPRWYWQRIGSPDLRGLPPLWASRYVTGDAGPAPVMYRRHNPAGWEPYGGLPVAVLQFTDRARVAGRSIDANAYLGSRDQFAALLGGQPPEDDMPSPADLWNHVLPDPFPGAQPKPARDLLGWAATHAAHARADAAAARAAVAEIAKQVADSDLDVEALITRMQEAVREAMAEIVHVNVIVSGPAQTPAP
jgi:GH25 family lysozyme M1 (1,4-beta-N-acetylmuramidase)